ncbi:hypothetical protein [Microbulbifer sp. GL-2]|uniref:hypothetical protein n=1 Tax=Microbulbifer sp. GL-2 TaxID=2591606 RepID=UPI0011643C3A|nr:hypothetical protein [Microbulbifer sp. GL-2]BBM02432.1 hypothetical protein GL2_25060 [Microbulbifer sp. GL-2]
MGILYHVHCPEADLKEWVETEFNLKFPHGPSRWPTVEELKSVVEQFTGFKIKYNENKNGIPHQVVMDFVEEPKDRLYALINIENKDEKGQESAFWFEKGSTELNIAITYAVSKFTGPIVIIADCGGPPIIVDYSSCTLSPIDQWIDITSKDWQRFYNEAR